MSSHFLSVNMKDPVPLAVMRKMKAARLKWTIPIIHSTIQITLLVIKR